MNLLLPFPDYTEDGGSTFLQNNANILPDYVIMVTCPRRLCNIKEKEV
jgi:hypothetical protein